METNKIYNQDCMELMKKLPENSIDCMVTDPPYGYSFMCQDWDKSVPSVDIWRECLRIMKPGAFAFIMSAPRMDVQTEMAIRIRHAGFEIGFTPIYWVYNTGFPKALNIGKKTQDNNLNGAYAGFNPKPAVEIIIVAMKPLSEKSYVAQAQKNGKGVTWLDNCRIPFSQNEPDNRVGTDFVSNNGDASNNQNDNQVPNQKYVQMYKNEGRFPANLICSDDILNDGDKNVGWHNNDNSGSNSRYFDIDAWYQNRFDDLPENVRKLFPCLIVPKPSTSEKDKGCEHMEDKQWRGTYKDQSQMGIMDLVNSPKLKAKNFHPSVKPIKLMSYLITLGSQKNDIILDPFAGSGTTCISAEMMARQYIGCELKKEYWDIAQARIDKLISQGKLNI